MSASPPLSFARKLLYAVILAGVTLALLLGGLELGLRLAGYGWSSHFFRRQTLTTGKTVWRENRWCTAPFFSADLVRRPQPVRLPEKKAPGTYRIFVLGSSAAMGDPEPAFSLARTLEAMLRAAYPERRFEVVNAAVTAINSHVVRGIADDCAELEPDLFIVYEGNNEVIGPFGPAGVLAPFLRSESAVRGAVWLKSTRTGQLVANLGRGRQPAEWGGMGMFLQQKIAADDPRLAAVREHFRANLQAIAASAQRAGAATILCTVPVNERDLAPFLSLHRRDLAPADLARWQEKFAAAEKAEAAGDAATAEMNYRAALAIDDRFAELSFRLGRLALAAGRDAEARDLLQRATDLDALRFRTDSALNQVIRDLPTAGTSIVTADLAAELAAQSPQGICGHEFFYEHVHLTLAGTHALASALFPRIGADLVRRGLVKTAAPVPFNYEEAKVRLGFNTYEQTMIAVELLNRFRKPPFADLSDNSARLEYWQRRVEAANALLARRDATTALRELARLALERAPDDWVLKRDTGAMLVSRDAPADALPLLQDAADWIDDDVDTLLALGFAHQALGHTADAEATFARARQLEPNYPGLPPANKLATH